MDDIYTSRLFSHYCKGKLVNENKWVKGFYLAEYNFDGSITPKLITYTINGPIKAIKTFNVITRTIVRSSGKFDVRGNLIFDFDKVKIYNGKDLDNFDEGIVVHKNCCWYVIYVSNVTEKEEEKLIFDLDLEVIGNEYDTTKCENKWVSDVDLTDLI